MKNYLKLLLALIIAICCIVSTASCALIVPVEPEQEDQGNDIIPDDAIGDNNNEDDKNSDTPPACTAHTDENLDGKCDDCGADVEIPEEKNECNQPGCDGEYVQSLQTPAKEFEDGAYLYTCDKCGDIYVEIIPATATIKVLVFTDTAIANSIPELWYALDGIGYGSVTVGTANLSTATISNHAKNIADGTGAYTFAVGTPDKKVSYRQTIETVLTAEDWDVVILSERAQSAATEASYAELSTVTSYIKEKADGAKILWNMTLVNNNKYSLDYAKALATAKKTVGACDNIDGIIPVATAFYNIPSETAGLAPVAANGTATDLGKYISTKLMAAAISNKEFDEIEWEPAEAIKSLISSYERIFNEAIANATESCFEQNAPEYKAFKILIFGNSYSNDANAYLAKIFLSAGYDEIVIGNVSDGGCNINHHWQNIDDTLEDYHPGEANADKVNFEGTAGCSLSVNGVGVKVSGATLKERYKNIVKAYEWDYVSIQHAPNEVERVDTYSYLPNLVDFVTENLTSEKTKLIFHMIWKYNDNLSNYNSRTETHYSTIIDITKNTVFANEEFAERVIPAVTFRQNMLTSYLEDRDISRDYGHMGLVLGRYALGLLWYCTLTGGDVDDVKFVPTEADVSDSLLEKYPEDTHHTVTDADMLVIKEAISNALENPYEITDSGYKTKP